MEELDYKRLMDMITKLEADLSLIGDFETLMDRLIKIEAEVAWIRAKAIRKEMIEEKVLLN